MFQPSRCVRKEAVHSQSSRCNRPSETLPSGQLIQSSGNSQCFYPANVLLSR